MSTAIQRSIKEQYFSLIGIVKHSLLKHAFKNDIFMG